LFPWPNFKEGLHRKPKDLQSGSGNEDKNFYGPDDKQRPKKDKKLAFSSSTNKEVFL